MGYVSWIGKMEKKESVLVTLLMKAGAVLYVKTSVPQSLMTGETVNNIIGKTTNPRNKNWSCGGSSGGEGALVALRGSVIGVGTDIGKFPNLSLHVTCDVNLIMTNRRICSDTLRLQLLIWPSSKPRPFPVLWNGQQYGGARNHPQRMWSSMPLYSRHEAFCQIFTRGEALVV